MARRRNLLHHPRKADGVGKDGPPRRLALHLLVHPHKADGAKKDGRAPALPMLQVENLFA